MNIDEFMSMSYLAQYRYMDMCPASVLRMFKALYALTWGLRFDLWSDGDKMYTDEFMSMSYLAQYGYMDECPASVLRMFKALYALNRGFEV